MSNLFGSFQYGGPSVDTPCEKKLLDNIQRAVSMTIKKEKSDGSDTIQRAASMTIKKEYSGSSDKIHPAASMKQRWF
jgi:hypothetical protein